MLFLNHTQNEAMCNTSTHQLPQDYQTVGTHHNLSHVIYASKLTLTKILPNIWLTLVLLYIFTIPYARKRCDTRSIFKRGLTGLNTEFSFSEIGCLNQNKETSVPFYLLQARRRIVGFLSILKLGEMQTVLSRIWTQIAEPISCDDNHYNTSTTLV